MKVEAQYPPDWVNVLVTDPSWMRRSRACLLLLSDRDQGPNVSIVLRDGYLFLDITQHLVLGYFQLSLRDESSAVQ
jgi:hypothetical protein